MAERRLGRVLAFLGITNVNNAIQLFVVLGGTTLLTAVGRRVVAELQVFSGVDLLLASVGFFLLVLAAGLALVPRFVRPKGPFGDVFGMAAIGVGISEERDLHIFRGAPNLRRECRIVAKKLYEFVERERKRLPAPPSGSPSSSKPTPEQVQYNADMAKALARFRTLYHTTWRHRVEQLVADARAMYFGPVPLTQDRYSRELHPDTVYEYAIALDRLSQKIPENYTDSLHAARIEQLRRLRRDGLALAVDIGEFMVERQQAAVVLQQQQAQTGTAPTDSRDQWQQSVNFSQETEAMFAGRFGGAVMDILQRLTDAGLTDEHLERLLGWGPSGLRISMYDLGGLAGSIGALSRRIPYE